MPELPEVETVKETLKKEVLNRVIKDVIIYYDGIIAYPSKDEFIKQIREEIDTKTIREEQVQAEQK